MNAIRRAWCPKDSYGRHTKPDWPRPGEGVYPRDRWRVAKTTYVGLEPYIRIHVTFECRCAECGEWVDAQSPDMRPSVQTTNRKLDLLHEQYLQQFYRARR